MHNAQNSQGIRPHCYRLRLCCVLWRTADEASAPGEGTHRPGSGDSVNGGTQTRSGSIAEGIVIALTMDHSLALHSENM
jgi:hypothetical protein